MSDTPPRSPQASDFKIATVQAVIFTDATNFSVVRVLQHFHPSVASIFNVEPVVLPSGGLPPEIPRVLLASEGGQWQAQVGPLRCDLIWRSPDTQNSAQIAAVLSQAAGWLFKYLEMTGSTAGRAAVVLTRFVECKLPGLMLAHHFCQERWYEQPLNRPQSFELHAHKSYQLGQTEVNSWFRAKSGEFETVEQKAPIVLAEQDLNTLPRDGELPHHEAATFFVACPEELDHILSLYFP
ncbi:MAG: hypothetical protein ACR2M4_09030 [Actinomycetota bacterium]